MIGDFEAYGLAHKAKASVVEPYNELDGESAYSSASSYNNIKNYIEVYRDINGPDADPTMHDLDPEVVMIAGKGKKNGRFLMGDGILSTASTPTLPQIKARQTSSSPAIRTRLESGRVAMEVSSFLFILLSL